MHRRQVQGRHRQRCVHELSGEHVLEFHGDAKRVVVYTVIQQLGGAGRQHEYLGLRVRVGIRVLLNKQTVNVLNVCFRRVRGHGVERLDGGDEAILGDDGEVRRGPGVEGRDLHVGEGDVAEVFDGACAEEQVDGVLVLGEADPCPEGDKVVGVRV